MRCPEQISGARQDILAADWKEKSYNLPWYVRAS